MSVVDYAAVQNALATVFQNEVVPQMNRSVVLLQLLPYKPALAKNLTWDADFSAAGEVTDSSLADGATVTVFNDDNLVPATLEFGSYSEAFSITGKARAAAMQTRNPDALADLFAEKMLRSVHRVTKNLGTDIYTGTGGNRLLGLVATAGGILSTGTYANVSRTTFPQFAGNESANGGTPRALTIDLMRDERRLIYTASGERPDLIVCDPVQHEAYGKLFGAQRQYRFDVYLRGQKITLDGGYNALDFDGIPVIQDIRCPAGQMLFLNSNHVYIRQLLEVPPDMVNGHTGQVQLQGMAEEQFGAMRTQLVASINPLGRAGNAYPFQLTLFPQIQVDRPNTCGRITDLS